MTEPISYTYAVVRDADGLPDVLAGIQGVARAPVHLVHDRHGGDVAAVVSPVPPEDFQEDALKRHLEDLDWLEAVARAHHSVVEALSAHTTVLPLRLATVYLDDERVAMTLDACQDTFSDRLSRLAAHVEWGVKIYVEPVAVTADQTDAAPAPGLSPGRAYLRSRRAQRHTQEDAYRSAERAAENVEAAAGIHAVDRARHRLQQGELAVGSGENVVNDAYLVPAEHAEAFFSDVMRAAEGLDAVRVEVTGPWAPYSFASPPDAEPAEGTASP
ncbi:GvpL/GvpF family gas vesicle protein [Streptomyces sp. NBC_00873]|uniref:GvpL/GvpF family gas vesicle protein n=1 Tax=unclassified Streptomyces TaxID=2593676 RepID=UPI00386BD63C|nr:GvpL/GvpF family gas vesicle protein [Streptomyces sp. NBC_00873]WTA48086.1 GvpL/GvpF family gas vesicle protein [Streptomyces sp. NBC_00842]